MSKTKIDDLRIGQRVGVMNGGIVACEGEINDICDDNVCVCIVVADRPWWTWCNVSELVLIN